jgi:DNA-binding transcriptional LysR family regulator
VNPKIELTSVIQALTVAEHLNFRRAAEALGVCQSSVSKRVMKLENLLGVDLFDRHHAGVKVTNAGIHFFEQVKLALRISRLGGGSGRYGWTRRARQSENRHIFLSGVRILAGTASTLFNLSSRD